MHRTFACYAALFMLLVVVSIQDAMAYIDPGSGSLLLQMIIAGLVGALFHFRGYVSRVISFLRNMTSRGDGKSK